MKRKVAAICLLIAGLPFLGSAKEFGSWPTDSLLEPVTQQTIVGIWEGVVGEYIFYRMEIRRRGNSYLVESSSQSTQTLYRLTSAKVQSGHVTLRFRKIDKRAFGTDELVFEGKGRADNSQGGIEGTMKQFPTRTHGATEIKLRKGNKYFRNLSAASKRAEALIRQE